MSHEKWFELAAGYAAGSLDGNDLHEFKGHVHQCEECMSYLLKSEETLVNLLTTLPLETPSSQVKSRVMEAVDAPPAMAADKGLRWNSNWAIAAVFALTGFLIVVGLNTTSEARHAREFARVEKTMMAQPGAQKVKLDGLEQAPGSTARMLWNSSGDCIFMTWGLPKNVSGKVYELWGISTDGPVPVGTFAVDKHGCGKLILKDFKPEQYEKLAVTLEPAGGVPKPTGPMVLLGSH